MYLRAILTKLSPFAKACDQTKFSSFTERKYGADGGARASSEIGQRWRNCRCSNTSASCLKRTATPCGQPRSMFYDKLSAANILKQVWGRTIPEQPPALHRPMRLGCHRQPSQEGRPEIVPSLTVNSSRHCGISHQPMAFRLVGTAIKDVFNLPRNASWTPDLFFLQHAMYSVCSPHLICQPDTATVPSMTNAEYSLTCTCILP